MMNIKSAISQMRVARRLGKLSSEQAARLLRRLGHSYALSQHEKIKAEMTAPPAPEWLAIMELRNSIEAEILPKLEAARKADDLLNNPAERRKVFTVMDACLEQADSVSAKVEAPKLEGYEYTREWWDEAERRERKERREANARN
jgi:hypothetical protein